MTTDRDFVPRRRVIGLAQAAGQELLGPAPSDQAAAWGLDGLGEVDLGTLRVGPLSGEAGDLFGAHDV